MGGSRLFSIMRVTTRCRSVEEFVTAFASLVDRDSIVVITDDLRPVGLRKPFVIELDDGSHVMRGQVQVIEATPPPRGTMRLRILALDGAGREVHERLLERAANRDSERITALTRDRKPLVRVPPPERPAAPPELEEFETGQTTPCERPTLRMHAFKVPEHPTERMAPLFPEGDLADGSTEVTLTDALEEQ